MFLPSICFIFFVFVASVKGEGCGSEEGCECGISKNIQFYEDFNRNDGQSRILGEKNSDPQDWPFIVMIFDCTGTIIHNQWILSAAHCEPEHFVNGSLNATINGKDYAVEKVISHSDFNNETLVKDIMLVKLKEPIEFSENVSSICLFKNLTVPEMEVAAVAGFGIKFVRVKTLNDTYQEEQLDSTEVIYENNDLLRETPVLIRNMSYCFDYEDYENEEESSAENVTETSSTENVTETSPTENATESAIICAGGANRGTTQGDSGGPLLVIRDHHWVQYGVTSFGSILPVPGDLLAVSDQGIYTKVNAYCDWIAEKTSNEVTCQ